MRIWTSTKWMLATMIAPEILLGKAWGDLEDAKFLLDALQGFATEDGVPWTLTHSLFANMGGFVIRVNTERTRGRLVQMARGTRIVSETPELIRQGDIAQSASGKKDQNACDSVAHTSRHDIYSEEIVSESNADPNGAQIKRATSVLQTQAPSYQNPFHLIASDILRLRRAGVLERLPYVTIEEIKDKSKGDSFARAIAVIQIAWTMVQVIARAIRHLAISQLEIAVVAFSVCAIIIYGLNWKKPKGVEVPYVLLQYQREIPKQVLRVLQARRYLEGSIFTGVADATGEAFGVKALVDRIFGLTKSKELGSPISNDAGPHFGSRRIEGITIGSILFGALHIAAWNFIFPSRVEQITWWITSLYCTGVFFTYILFLLLIFCGVLLFDMSERSLMIGIVLGISLYVLARLFLIVEIFRTLCFLPPDAYVATWASNIPHIV